MAHEIDVARAVIFVRGHVQGVGFRWWTRARALELALVGHARNLPDGRVEIAAQGRRDDIETLHDLLRPDADAPCRPGRVSGATLQWHSPRDGVIGFVER